MDDDKGPTSLVAGVSIAMVVGLVVTGVVWVVWIDESEFVPPAGGTAVTLPGGFVLGQNRRVLFNEETGVCYCRYVLRYAVADGLIVGQDEEGWFIIDWKLKSLEQFKDMQEYAARLHELGVAEVPRLRAI